MGSPSEAAAVFSSVIGASSDSAHNFSNIGACAADFLASRFDSDVWPGLQAVLASAALAVAALSLQAQRGGTDGGHVSRATPAHELIMCALRIVALLARPAVTIEREPDAEEATAKDAQGRSVDDSDGKRVQSQPLSSSETPQRGLPLPPAVPAFLPADSRARSASAAPAHPTVYSLGRTILHRHVWECACLLAATVSAGRRADSRLSRNTDRADVAPKSTVSAIIDLAVTALRALARFVDANTVDQALQIYGLSQSTLSALSAV